jgi:hypothetical protein
MSKPYISPQQIINGAVDFVTACAVNNCSLSGNLDYKNGENTATMHNIMQGMKDDKIQQMITNGTFFKKTDSLHFYNGYMNKARELGMNTTNMPLYANIVK